MGAGGDDFVVQRIDQVCHFGRGAGGDFLDGGDAVLFVARVDAFGAVAGEKINVELEAREFFEYRHAVFFRRAGVHGGFVNHDVAGLEDFAYGFAGLHQGREVGALVFVNRGGHGDDKAVALAQIFKVGGKAQVARGL